MHGDCAKRCWRYQPIDACLGLKQILLSGSNSSRPPCRSRRRHRLRVQASRCCKRGTMAARRDGDERRLGIGHAAQLVTGASELVAAFRQPNWVAEQPEVHLLPEVEAWCQSDQGLALTDAYIDVTEAYFLDFEWHGATGGVGAGRAAVFSLIGPSPRVRRTYDSAVALRRDCSLKSAPANWFPTRGSTPMVTPS